MTRGKAKTSASAFLKNTNVIKHSKGSIDHLREYANGVKSVYGNNVDNIDFIRAAKLNDFAKNKGYVLENIEDLGKNDILAVATKSDEPLFTSVFKFDEWADDLLTKFGDDDTLRIIL